MIAAVPAPSPELASAPAAFDALSVAERVAGPGLRRLLALQAVRTALRLGFAATAAMAAGRLVMGETIDPWLIAGMIALLAAACLAGFAAERMQASAENAVSTRLRALAGER